MAQERNCAAHWPCLARAVSLEAAVEHSERWKAAGATGVIAPVPWRTGGRSHRAAPLDADLSERSGLPIGEEIAEAGRRLADQGLTCHLELALNRVARGALPATARPEWLQPDLEDPRTDPRVPHEDLITRRVLHAPPESFARTWIERLRGWLVPGISGFCFRMPQQLEAATWRELLSALREACPGASFIAWTPGLVPEEVARCAAAHFDWTVSSLAWWNGRADWLAEEHMRLRAAAPVLAYAGRRHEARWLAAAALSGEGIILDSPLDAGIPLCAVAAWRRGIRLPAALSVVGGRAGQATALVRAQAGAQGALLALSAEGDPEAGTDPSEWSGLLPAGPADACGVPAVLRASAGRLGPSGCALWQWTAPAAAVGASVTAAVVPGSGSRALAPRISVECIEPAVNAGAWPVKRIAHETLEVSAVIFTDGHAKLAANLFWRACDESEWHEIPMREQGNDRWTAQCRPERIGRHEYRILAWMDTWAGFLAEWRARLDAGQPLGLGLAEGAQWLERVLKHAGLPADGPGWSEVRRVLAALKSADGAVPDARRIGLLFSERLAAFLRDAGMRPFACATPPMGLWVDRPQARHANWYELFPRSQSPTPGVHGTFDDVIARLPDIRRMGFDVLYLTPIHPVGRRNRKGRNNSLEAVPGDVGSPYAIGAEEGGHDAVEPRLGTLEDFDRLVDASRRQGLEIAMDFAIQCSPDHPWLSSHRDWFGWRPDGSLRYAENPPKKYQDIVNVTFYEDAAPWRRKIPLWRALRDIVRFWIGHGVRIFRVDNPHTKPLPFWQWLIAEIHSSDPDVVFLAEAFTRPAMMYRLAKAGFTQSYTYFTWRNTAAEIDAYFHELSRPPVADYFRPMFFASTPDINPPYLQRHGRPGFLVRAALAATGSGLWGIYSGFELCEAEALPGGEEHADSEKYELRQRDWHAPGNIRAEIAQLNAIRRANPALQGHRGYLGLPTWRQPV